MQQNKTLKIILGLLFVLIFGCEDITEREKYQRPDWLPGKLYSTVSVQEDLDMFQECLQLTGLDTIINVSGSWTVFAPTNEAIQQYLAEKQYASLEAIPEQKLLDLVKFHIIQNPWTLEQLQSLSVNGWRSTESYSTNSYAFKRETILKNPVKKYWITRSREKEMIVSDSSIADAYKRVYVKSRKYVPIFYDDYNSVNGLSSEDFNFYFGRPFEPGNVYYARGKIIESDIFAENGFLHIIDKVIEPMRNGQELLEIDEPNESYKLFHEMVNWYYPSFEANMNATNNQPSVRSGGLVDTLWDLQYSGLQFDLHEELIGYKGSNYNQTLASQNGLYVPTDEAFSAFIDGILTANSGYPHWHDYRELPSDIIRLIFPQHFKSIPIYPSGNDYQTIFRQEGRLKQNEGDIVRKEYGSNCTFIGLSSYIPSKVFTGVTGPVFCRPSFTNFRLALEATGLGNAIADIQSDQLCFFPIPDFALELDSSMVLDWIDKENLRFNFREYDRLMKQWAILGASDLSTRILNHFGTLIPNGSANKEFIPTLAGNYIIWNNSENTVQGTLPSTVGFAGTTQTICEPVELLGPFESGRNWTVNYWFNFSTRNIVTTISKYTLFFELLKKAGLFDEGSQTFTFLDRDVPYTIFAPSDDALIDYNAEDMDNPELSEFLKYHFLKGALIFTDNKQPSDVYLTETNASLEVRTGPDIIEILNADGNPYVTIHEEENVNNRMVSERSRVMSVVHEIDHVLIR